MESLPCIRVDTMTGPIVHAVELLEVPGEGWSAFLLPGRDLGVLADTREQALVDLATVARQEYAEAFGAEVTRRAAIARRN